MPNLNSGTPWSELADFDLRWCFDHDWPLEAIPDFLCRDVEEVVQRMRDLGLLNYRRTSAGLAMRIVDSLAATAIWDRAWAPLLRRR